MTVLFQMLSGQVEFLCGAQLFRRFQRFGGCRDRPVLTDVFRVFAQRVSSAVGHGDSIVVKSCQGFREGFPWGKISGVFINCLSADGNPDPGARIFPGCIDLQPG